MQFLIKLQCSKKSHDGAFQVSFRQHQSLLIQFEPPDSVHSDYDADVVAVMQGKKGTKRSFLDHPHLDGGCDPLPVSARRMFYSSSTCLGQSVFLPQGKSFVIKPFLCSISGCITKRIFLPASSMLLDVSSYRFQVGGMEQKSDPL